MIDLEAPARLQEERKKWRRFELITDDRDQINRLNRLLEEQRITREDLALIVACLRIRPEFSLSDFKTPTASVNSENSD